jgi:DNA-directed RNA polymerase specialized sigma24 family protein
LSPQVRKALRDEAKRLEAAGGPVEQVRAVGDAFAALDAELERVAKVRLRAVAQLRRDGWSYDRIAAATGLSKGRVAQLVKDPRNTA